MPKSTPESDKSLFDQIKSDVKNLAEQVRREHGDELAEIVDSAKDEWRKFSRGFHSRAGEWREHAAKRLEKEKLHRPRHGLAGWRPGMYDSYEMPFAFWSKRTRRTRGLLFVRLALVFGVLSFLLVGGLVVIVWVASEVLRTAGQLAGAAWFVGFLLAVGFLIGGGVMAFWRSSGLLRRWLT